MMPKGFHQIEDFLTDDSFCNWILSDKQADNERWNRYLVDHPTQVETIAQASGLLKQLAAPTNERTLEVDKAWHRLQNNLPSAKVKASVRPIKRWYYAAASIAAIAILVFFGWPRAQSYYTDFGEIRQVTLPDGTAVTLQANSRLWWEAEWEDQAVRQVFLEGEAYFEVSPATENEGKAFIVTAQPLNVEVLGTVFNVVNRTHRQQITLVEGRVKTNAIDEAAVILTPGEQYNWSTATQSGETKKVDTQLFVDWRNNIWHFQATPLAEVAQRIEDHFGVSIHFTDQQTKARTLSGALPAIELSQIIEFLQLTMNIRITEQQDQLTISAGIPQ